MGDQDLPVTVAVARPDGGVEHVRVGTAVRHGEGFSLKLGELEIGSTKAAAEPRRRAPASASSAGDAPSVFPPYGRSKGAPIAGASIQDLEFYANGARRTLSDPSKARFHDKERTLLAILEAELGRQRDEPTSDGGYPPPHGDDDAH
jgi:hypothetical protein